MESDICGFKSQICHWLALWPWAGDLLLIWTHCSFGLKVFKNQRHPEVSSDALRWQKEPILSFGAQSVLEIRALFLQLEKKKRLRGSVLTCLRSHRGRDLNQRPFGHKIYSVRTILAHLHGDSYRTRSGHLARTSSIIHCFLPLSPLMPLNMVGKAQVILIMSALTKTYFYLL